MRSHLGLVSRVLLLAIAPFALDGCVSVGLSRAPLADSGSTPSGSTPSGSTPSGSLEVAVYERAADRDADSPYPLPVLSQLFVRENGADRLLAQSMASRWGLPELAPGRYTLKLAKRIDERGDVEALPSPSGRTFEVRAGERTRAEVVLKKVPVAWIVLAAITVVVLVLLSIEWAKEGKLPLPPLPPLPHHLPVVVTFPVGGRATSAMDQPGVADVFPARGSVVAARRVTVNFFMTTRLEKLEPGAVQALGSLSGDIPGQLSFRDEEQLLRFTPERDFTPGEKVTVTLDLSKLRGRAGAAGSGTFTTSFGVPSGRR